MPRHLQMADTIGSRVRDRRNDDNVYSRYQRHHRPWDDGSWAERLSRRNSRSRSRSRSPLRYDPSDFRYSPNTRNHYCSTSRNARNNCSQCSPSTRHNRRSPSPATTSTPNHRRHDKPGENSRTTVTGLIGHHLRAGFETIRANFVSGVQSLAPSSTFSTPRSSNNDDDMDDDGLESGEEREEEEGEEHEERSSVQRNDSEQEDDEDIEDAEFSPPDTPDSSGRNSFREREELEEAEFSAPDTPESSGRNSFSDIFGSSPRARFNDEDEGEEWSGPLNEPPPSDAFSFARNDASSPANNWRLARSISATSNYSNGSNNSVQSLPPDDSDDNNSVQFISDGEDPGTDGELVSDDDDDEEEDQHLEEGEIIELDRPQQDAERRHDAVPRAERFVDIYDGDDEDNEDFDLSVLFDGNVNRSPSISETIDFRFDLQQYEQEIQHLKIKLCAVKAERDSMAEANRLLQADLLSGGGRAGETDTIPYVECAICMAKAVEVVLAPCGHTLCEECSTKISNCHMCSKEIRSTQKFFLT